MSPTEWQGDGLVLRKDTHGESYLKLLILSPEWGMLHALLRYSSRGKGRSGTMPEPDLFDEIHARFAPSKNQQLAFVQEWQLLNRQSALGGSYERLLWAVRLSQSFIPNLTHIEETEWTYKLLKKSLAAIGEKPLPEASYCKALFLFARHQGYPVVEGWLGRISPSRRSQAEHLVQEPLANINLSADQLEETRKGLEQFLRIHSDFNIPE